MNRTIHRALRHRSPTWAAATLALATALAGAAGNAATTSPAQPAPIGAPAPGHVQRGAYHDDNTPPGTANYGLFNFGPGPWDGVAANFFAGSSSGTMLAGNVGSAYAGDFLDFQSAGAAQFKVSSAGATSVGSGATPLTLIKVYSPALTPASVAVNTTAEQTFTLTGLATNDKCLAIKPSAQAGLAIGNVRVSAANTLAITYVNDTAAAIVPTAETYAVVCFRS